MTENVILMKSQLERPSIVCVLVLSQKQDGRAEQEIASLYKIHKMKLLHINTYQR